MCGQQAGLGPRLGVCSTSAQLTVQGEESYFSCLRTQDQLLVELGTLITGVPVVSGRCTVHRPSGIVTWTSPGIAADVTMVGHLSGEPGTIKASHTPRKGKGWRGRLSAAACWSQHCGDQLLSG